MHRRYERHAFTLPIERLPKDGDFATQDHWWSARNHLLAVFLSLLLLGGWCCPDKPALAADVGRAELEQAEAEYLAAYRRHAALVTSEGTGRVEETLGAYRDAYQRYEALREGAGEQVRQTLSGAAQEASGGDARSQRSGKADAGVGPAAFELRVSSTAGAHRLANGLAPVDVLLALRFGHPVEPTDIVDFTVTSNGRDVSGLIRDNGQWDSPEPLVVRLRVPLAALQGGGAGLQPGETSLRFGCRIRLRDGQWQSATATYDFIAQDDAVAMSRPDAAVLQDAPPAAVAGSPRDAPSPATSEARPPPPAAAALTTLTQRDAAVLLEALAFRSVAALGFGKAVEQPDRKATFAALLTSANYRTDSHAWSHFFDGAFVFLGTDASGTRVTAFYNPYYDAAVVVTWDDAVPVPRMRGAATVSGDRIRGDAAAGGAGLPGWLSTAGASSGGLSAQFARFVAAFERHYPPPGRASDAAEFLVDDAASRERIQLLGDIQVAALLALRDRLFPELTALSQELRAALARGDENALTGLLPKENPVAAREILQLPELLRASLVPTQMLPGLGRALVVLADPRLPRFGLLVFFQTAPDVKIDHVVPFALSGDLPN